MKINQSSIDQPEDTFWDRISSAFGTSHVPTIAEKLGLSTTAIYKWRDGKSLPDGRTLIEIFRQTGSSAQWILVGSEPIEKEERIVKTNQNTNKLGVPPLKLEKFSDGFWVFNTSEAFAQVEQDHDQAIDFMEMGQFEKAEQVYQSILKKCPNHLAAFNNLAFILEMKNRVNDAFSYWQKGAGIGVRLIPSEFIRGTDSISWRFEENRPFLKLCHGLGLWYQNQGYLWHALGWFIDILDFDPNDAIGVRALLVQLFLKLEMPGKVLEICDRFHNCPDIDLLYGRALALFSLKRYMEGLIALDEAIKWHPDVAKMLCSTKISKQQNATTLREDPSQRYLRESGKYWQENQLAMAMLDLYVRSVSTSGTNDKTTSNLMKSSVLNQETVSHKDIPILKQNLG